MISKLYKTSIKIISSLSVILGVISLTSALPVYAASAGSVGTWTTEANALPAPVSGASSVFYNGHVYIMGGNNYSTNVDTFLNTVYSAPLNANGSVGTWTTEANALPAPSLDATAVAYNGYVYVMGGFDGTSDVNTVYSAPLNANGSVGTWTTEANALPVYPEGATAITYNGYIYIMGGNYSAGVHSTVYSAPLNANGSVGTWTTEANALPTGLWNASAVVSSGHVYVMGGNNGTNAVSTVYSAPLNANGSVGTWTTEANALPASFNAANSVANNGFIYVIGGTDGYSFYSTVYSALIASQSSGGSTTSNTVLGVPDTGSSNLITNAKDAAIKSIIPVVAILLLAYFGRRRLKN